MSDDTAEFLTREGAIPLIAVLNVEQGHIVEEIYSQLDVSRKSLSTLLADAQEHDLVKIDLLPSDHGNAKRFILTQRGVTVAEEIERMGLYETYTEMKSSEREYDTKKGELKIWASEQLL